MRPKVERRYVFIGSVTDGGVQGKLAERSQRERDAILGAGVESVGLREVAGRLGNRVFTLVGGDRFEASMKDVGKEVVEERLRGFIAEALENEGPDS